MDMLDDTRYIYMCWILDMFRLYQIYLCVLDMKQGDGILVRLVKKNDNYFSNYLSKFVEF